MKKFNRKVIIAKVIKKLSKKDTNPQILNSIVENIKEIYQKK